MKLEVENYKTKEAWSMQSVDGEFKLTDADLQAIASICNQSEVHALFSWLGQNPYTVEDAQKFISWATEGWKNDQYYVFLIRDVEGNISSCVDIKKIQNSDNDFREIGYWADKSKPGIVTNAVLSLGKFANTKGIIGLYGLVVPENIKSQEVLIRAGYLYTGDEFNDEKQKVYKRFEMRLK